MAKAAGVSRSTVPRIWDAHGLQPHRITTFKLSKDPAVFVYPVPASGSAVSGAGAAGKCRYRVHGAGEARPR